MPYGQKTSYTTYFSRVQSPFADRTTVAAYTWPLSTIQHAPECDLKLDFPFDDEVRVDSENGPQMAVQADVVKLQAYLPSDGDFVHDLSRSSVVAVY